MATTETYKDRTTGERKEQTEWHNVVLWRGLAEIASKYLKKGDMAYVEGKLRTRSYEKDGITRYTTEIVGDNMTMLSPKGSGGGAGASNSPSMEEPAGMAGRSGESFSASSNDPAGDDLPF
jgi:single-strand DNA-binding protein